MARKTVDWEAIEPHWRAGIKTKLQISEEFGVSRAALDKHFAKEGIERDLTTRIQAKAEALVTRSQVTSVVTPESRATDREIIEANAQAIVAVRIGQRRDIQRGRSIAMSLFAELEASCGEENVALLNQLGEMLRAPDEFGNDKLNDLYHKIISLPGRAKTMKDLTASLATLIDKERQAFGLDKGVSERESNPVVAMATSELVRLREALLRAGDDGA